MSTSVSYNNLTAQKVKEIIALKGRKPISEDHPLHAIEVCRRQASLIVSDAVRHAKGRYISCPRSAFKLLGDELLTKCLEKKHFIYHKGNIPTPAQLAWEAPQLYVSIMRAKP